MAFENAPELIRPDPPLVSGSVPIEYYDEYLQPLDVPERLRVVEIPLADEKAYLRLVGRTALTDPGTLDHQPFNLKIPESNIQSGGALTLGCPNDAGEYVGAVTVNRQPADGKFWINTLVVADVAKGQGVASRLMTRVLEYVGRQTNVDQVKLKVYLGNIPARKLYALGAFEVCEDSTNPAQPLVLCLKGRENIRLAAQTYREHAQ